ncbi:sigma factor-like helix-turn-helix DNA-binding protein [Nocardia harenae]|uniref:sigma factor-like helix-turn-helix DNA-binding protein n=1 Tax=Nocardia harenae TaxID=358707 RepID=UPI000B218027|nr:sigma factor-like helix-turn-helix DNA-binding protein [Nocardia harenae]
MPGRIGWLGEPQAGAADPADRVTLDESLGMAFLVVLDAMTPAERVAFVLHDVFGYPFAEIAAIVGRSPGACRQLASSARRRLRSSHRPVPHTARETAVVAEFRRAWQAGDIDALVEVLDPGVTAIADTGGLARGYPHPLRGAEQVAHACVEVRAKVAELTLREHAVNGRPGLVALLDGAVVTVYALDVAGSRITRIWAIRNPEKLRAWT